MKLNEMLASLRYELRQLDEAIFSLERIDQGRGKVKKLGRPLGSKNNPKVMRLAV
jgi:hypothetical protein